MSCATDSRPARTERKPLYRHRFTDSSIAVVVFAELDVSSWCHWFLIARCCRTRCSNAFGAVALDSDDKVAVVKRLAVTPPGVNNVGTRVDSLLCHPGAGRYRAGIRWPTSRRTSMPFFCSTQAWVLDLGPRTGQLHGLASLGAPAAHHGWAIRSISNQPGSTPFQPWNVRTVVSLRTPVMIREQRR